VDESFFAPPLRLTFQPPFWYFFLFKSRQELKELKVFVSVSLSLPFNFWRSVSGLAYPRPRELRKEFPFFS